MALLGSSVTIAVRREIAPRLEDNLGTILVVGTNISYDDSSVTERYADPDEIIDDDNVSGVTTSDYEYLAVESIYAQGPWNPSYVVVAPRGTPVAQVMNVLVDGNDNGSYVVTINGTAFTYSASSASGADIHAALLSAVNGGSQPVTASGTSPNLVLTADNAGEPFTASVSAPSDNLVLTTTTANTGYFELLTAIAADDDTWFGLVIEDRADHHLRQAARYAEANNKFFFGQSDDSAGIGGSGSTDIVSILSALSYNNTAIMLYSDDAVPAAEAAMGAKLPVPLDRQVTTWAYANLVGILPDTWSTTVQTNARTKGANIYSTKFSRNVMWEGTTVTGQYIDTTMTIEWTKRRLPPRIFDLFAEESANGARVPLSDQGIAQVLGIIEAFGDEGEDIGHFSAGTSEIINPPRRSTLTDAEVSTRTINPYWQAEITGAIHVVNLTADLVSSGLS